MNERIEISSARPGSKFGNVFRVAAGNFLEMYDFMVYG